MEAITLFDTSTSSANSADHYLTETCYQILSEILPYYYFYKISTHNILDETAKIRLIQSKFGIICGSGILSSKPPSKMQESQWRVYPDEIKIPVIGMGIGFENDKEVGKEAIEFYKRIFQNKLIGARGEYTYNTLRKNGINAINTGCPTLWRIQWARVREIKNENVIFAVNTYRDFDYKSIYELLIHKYNNVFLFCQHPNDENIYRKFIPQENLKFTPCNLYELGEFAIGYGCDYVGARVHAAAYLVRLGIRSILIPVDIRGVEVWKYIGLPTALNSYQLDLLVDTRLKFEPNIQYQNIKIWKESLK